MAEFALPVGETHPLTLEGKQFLLVDRAADIEATETILRQLGVRVSVAADATEALALARREEFDMAMIGVGVGGGENGDPLERLTEGGRIPSILMLASPPEARRAIQALSRGASDYLLKPLQPGEVVARVERLLRWQEQDVRTKHLQHEVGRRYLLENVVSLSPGMQRVREQVLQVAPARSTVLIQGESGVGKELVAKAIHYNSARRRTRSSPSIAPPSRSPSSRASCSGTKGERSRALLSGNAANSSWPTAERSFSTKSARWICRPSLGCCACSRSASSCAWGGCGRCAWTSACSRRPIARSGISSPRGGFARISISA